VTKKTVQILNTRIDNITKLELLEQLGKGGIVITPNVDHLMILQKDQEFFKAYQMADYRVCDSKILMYAAQFLGSPITEKISGSDLFPAFYEHYRNDDSVKIFLLGGAEGVAEKAKQNINKKMGREIIVQAHSPSMGFEKFPEECEKIIEIINQSDANVLAIGLGAPKQEKWIVKYGSQLTKIKTILGIGATIDFEAGNKPRAPKWMSEVGLEWSYRLLSEPKRLWKRYLIDALPFFWLILKQKLNLYISPFEQSAYQFYSVPLGEILIQKNLISLQELDKALKIQEELTEKKKLGEILLSLDVINQNQLKEALLEQRNYQYNNSVLIENKVL